MCQNASIGKVMHENFPLISKLVHFRSLDFTRVVNTVYIAVRAELYSLSRNWLLFFKYEDRCHFLYPRPMGGKSEIAHVLSRRFSKHFAHSLWFLVQVLSFKLFTNKPFYKYSRSTILCPFNWHFNRSCNYSANLKFRARLRKVSPKLGAKSVFWSSSCVRSKTRRPFR